MSNFTVSLDLGQSVDSSAALLVERVHVIVPEDESHFERQVPDGAYWYAERLIYDTWHVRHIRRWPLGTDYTVIVADVGDMFSEPELRHQAVLVMDYSGVGRGVHDMFIESYRAGRLGDRWPVRVTLSGGFATDASSQGVSSHKGDVVSKLLAAAQRGRVTIVPELPLAGALESEIRNFILKQNKRTGGLRFEAKGSSHDDMLLALAMAVWHKHNHGEPRFVNERGELEQKPWAIATPH